MGDNKNNTDTINASNDGFVFFRCILFATSESSWSEKYMSLFVPIQLVANKKKANSERVGTNRSTLIGTCDATNMVTSRIADWAHFRI